MDFNEYTQDVSDSLWDEAYDFDLSDLVTKARLHAGLTQEQLAKCLGTKQPSVARVESGSVLPSHKFLKRVARAVGTKLFAPTFEFMNDKQKVYLMSTKIETQDNAYMQDNSSSPNAYNIISLP